MIIPLVYKCLNRLRFHKVNLIQYWNIMRVTYDINVLNVRVFLQIIVIFTFISTTIFAHPHSSNDLGAHPHTHPKNENDLIDDPDQFKYLDLQSSNPSSYNNSTQNQEKKKLILFDDNFYLLDDDFDFGTDEIELQKMELNKDDLETAKEYENFLNAFFEESKYIGSKTSNPKSQTKGNVSRLNNMIKSLENENKILSKKIYKLEKQLKKTNKNSAEVNDFESEKRLLHQKIENLNKQLQSTRNDNSSDGLEAAPSSFDELPEKINDDIINSSNKSGFGVSIAMGATIPILQTGFGLGPNGGIRLETPASFHLAGMDCKVGAEFYGAMMLPKDSTTYTIPSDAADDVAGRTPDGDALDIENWTQYQTNLTNLVVDPLAGLEYIDPKTLLDTITVKNDKLYSLMNIVGNISISPSFIPALEIRPGLGLTLTKIGEDSKPALSIPFDIIYYFPMDLAGFKFGLNLLSQITLGHPTKAGTTSLINAGLVIKTPLRF